MDSSEVRITNPKTGGQKGQKLARYDLIPPRAIEALAEHYGRGAQKYADRNWEKGVDWSLSFAAMQRHVWAWWNGEEADNDGNSHLAAAMWHVAALIEYGHTHPELDDRPRQQEWDAEDKFDEDFLAYLDWRDGFHERNLVAGALNNLFAWKDTR